MSDKKNKAIMNIYNKIKKISLHEYDDINPEEYISPEHFVRLFTTSDKFAISTFWNEKPNVVVNKAGYGYIVFPPPSLFDNNINEIDKLSSKISKIENKVKAWVIDLRSNFGGFEHLFQYFVSIFIPDDYEGILYSIIKGDNDILHDVSIYNNDIINRQKYSQSISVHHIKKELIRTKIKKNIHVLVNDKTASGGEFVCLILKSFGAKIYGSTDKTSGALNMTSGYILDEHISVHFPNAFIYDKNNLKHNIYIESSLDIKKKFLLP